MKQNPAALVNTDYENMSIARNRALLPAPPPTSCCANSPADPGPAAIYDPKLEPSRASREAGDEGGDVGVFWDSIV
jgi:hypothetical protein